METSTQLTGFPPPSQEEKVDNSNKSDVPFSLVDRSNAASTSNEPRCIDFSSELARLNSRIDELERTPRQRRHRGRGRSCSTCVSSHEASDTEAEQIGKNEEDIKSELEVRDPRVLYIKSHWDSSKGTYVDRPGKPSPVYKPPAPDDEHGIVWKEKTRGKGRPELNFHEAEVLNEKLKLLLSETLKSYPGHWVDEMIFSSRPLPFPPLIHNWAKLQELSKERADDKECELARRDLRSLLLEVRRSNECKEYFDSLEQFLKDRVISFECLWTIFPPGTIVLATPYKETQAFVVSDVAYFFPYGVDQNVRRTLRDIDSDDDGEFDNWLALQCWCYDFDGEEFRRIPYQVKIPRYPGKKKVTALPCFPLELDEDAENIRERLIKRGRKFRAYNIREEERMIFYHKGKAYKRSARASSRALDERISLFRRTFSVVDDTKLHNRETMMIEINGRVLVDAKMFCKYGPPISTWMFERPKSEWQGQECPCANCQSNPDLMKTFRTAYDFKSKDENGRWLEFSDEQLLLCSSRVLGYELDRKIWVLMLVDNIKTISQHSDESAFDDLVLPDDLETDNTKFLIKSLVKHHMTARSSQSSARIGGLEDFVEGKGRGLVILLHGQSGTGKTLTVECVSKLTGKPLLKISVADIGINPEYVEERLSIYFDLAAAWDAILLIDEADILLEARTQDEGRLERNAMVSVFLKILEYYQGILLLTTNRVKTIDIAVESRLNLAVEFHNMQAKEQRILFKKLLDRLNPADIADRDDLDRWIDRYFRPADFNGRDIRNLISSALAISRAHKEKLARRHIETVKMSKETSQQVFAEQRAVAKKGGY